VLNRIDLNVIGSIFIESDRFVADRFVLISERDHSIIHYSQPFETNLMIWSNSFLRSLIGTQG
jgi:hypothetical protein